MRRTSLKNFTLKYLLLYILLIIAVWAGLFYAYILDEVYDNVDDGLKNQKIFIIREAYSNEDILKTTEFGINQFRITPISQNQFSKKDVLQNEMVFMPYDDEMEPYRILKTCFLDHSGNPYQLEIRTSTVEEDDLLIDLAVALIALYILLMVSIYIINQIVLRKAFLPFKNIINQLKNYRFGEKHDFKNPETNVAEFHTLSEGISLMLNDNQETFLQQKSFIENASHELKTPIAIIGNKLDWMIENENLTEEQLLQLVEIKKTSKRMSDLVGSLLMLSKIENHQFQGTSSVNANEMIKSISDEFQEWMEYKELDFQIKEFGIFTVTINENLLRILLNNLLLNAIKYTEKEGNIEVQLYDNKIEFSNTASGSMLDSTLIFNRFYKHSKDNSSTGLGLAIAQSIIKNTTLKLDYYFAENRHHFVLKSSNS